MSALEAPAPDTMTTASTPARIRAPRQTFPIAFALSAFSAASCDTTHAGLTVTVPASASQPLHEQTAIPTAPNTRRNIAELRRMSGLIWEQCARLFGVSRRSVHHWVSGEAMSASQAEHLSRLLAVLRFIDRGRPTANRALLLEPIGDAGQLVIELLANHQYDDIRAIAGRGAADKRTPAPPLSATAAEARRPLPPDILAGALQDTIHQTIPGRRPARSTRYGA